MSVEEDRIGEVAYNKYGSKMEIIKYNNSKDIDILFDSGYISTRKMYSNFIKGRAQSPYCKKTKGVGFIGEGKYTATIEGKHTDAYRRWAHMIRRCYSNEFKEKYSAYKNCTMSEDWLNFQNFAEWQNNNHYTISDEKMHLDKDILEKGNKIYSPETCIFVPHRINNLFIKSGVRKGSCPIGVHWAKSVEKYNAHCQDANLNYFNIGYFDNSNDAFLAYKHKKEEVIKQVADKYKDYIPKKLYNAMYRYEVEITD